MTVVLVKVLEVLHPRHVRRAVRVVNRVGSAHISATQDVFTVCSSYELGK